MSAPNPWKQIDQLHSEWTAQLSAINKRIHEVTASRGILLTVESDGAITTWIAKLSGLGRVSARNPEALVANCAAIARSRGWVLAGLDVDAADGASLFGGGGRS